MSGENEDGFAEVLVSRWKLDVLDELFNRSGYEFTIKELSEKTSGSYGSVRSFVHSLRDRGIVEVVKKGGSLLVSYREGNKHDNLIRNLLKTESDYLRQKAEDYVESLVGEFPEVDAVILYGSVARQEAGPNSDIDLLVLGEVSEEKIRDHAHENSVEVIISPIVESRKEFKRNLERGNGFEKQLKQDGVMLYGEIVE